MSDTRENSERLAALEADNARLRRLLDEAGLHDGLRHAFRDVVAVLRAIIRRSAESAEDVEAYAAHLVGRIDALARARTRTDALGEADLHTLVSDELMIHVVHEGERATISGPSVRLRPKAAQVLALAVHELATNAIEHGPLAGPDGRVDVRWSIEADLPKPVLAVVWTETGGTDLAAPGRRGFGTAMLEEMLAYDLGADTVLTIEPDGARCEIRLPLSKHLGRLAEDGAAADIGDEAP